MCLSLRTTGNTSIFPVYATVHMSVCICKVIKVAVQLRSKWKLIRNILNWFGVYSNSKPEFLLLVVKLDKCFMVKPFKSTHKGTPKFGQIFEKFHFRIINDSLYCDISLRKLITWKMSPLSAIQTFWRTSLYPFFPKKWWFSSYLWFCTELLW